MGKPVETNSNNSSISPNYSTKKKPMKPKKQLSKKELRKANSRPIPKEVLDDILQLVKLDDFCEDRNKSCTAAIHSFGSAAVQSSFNIKLQFIKHARLCLLRRDWENLSKLLAIANDTGSKFHIFSKYLALCVAYTDEVLFDAYLQSTYSFTRGSSKGIRLCTKLKVNANTNQLFPKNDD